MAKKKAAARRREKQPVVVDSAVAQLRQQYTQPVEGLSTTVVATIRRKVDEFRTEELLFFRKSTLKELLRKTNVYRYAATMTSPRQFIKWALFASYAGSAASRFGHMLEDSAIDIANEAPNRRAAKTSTGGFDAEIWFLDGNHRRLCQCMTCMKSGRKVFNKDSTKGQGDAVQTGMAVLRQSVLPYDTYAVWFVAYGASQRGSSSPKLNFDLCVTGQAAWAFLSGNSELYITLCKIVAEGAQEFETLLAAEQQALLSRLNNSLVTGKYITPNNQMDWAKVLQQTCGNYGSMMKNPLFRAMMDLDFPKSKEGSA